MRGGLQELAPLPELITQPFAAVTDEVIMQLSTKKVRH